MEDNLKYKICIILKAVQFFFVLSVAVLEIVQVIFFKRFFPKWLNYLDDLSDYYSSDYPIGGYGNSDYPSYSGTSTYYTLSSPSSNPINVYFTKASIGKGPAAIWIFIVMIITFLSLIGYTLLFEKIWNLRKHILFIGFDAAFVLLWLSEVFTNLIWIYKGLNSAYVKIPNLDLGYSSVYFSDLNTVDVAYTASNLLGWLVLVSFIISFGFSFKIHNDAISEAQTNQVNNNNTNNMTSI
ncbi:hypothetical protein Glove_139g27 [Diversispora epigaea]|uniref:MARVEL domain-containing protein n=1 Tax=Diversispora epigaea TaxID=1348612 RepID=A0A397IW36_9GLOM|nr:hypothetical protein Glove_139g27 [Diversispora epigaea]